MKSSLKKYFLILVGSITLSLGVLGMFVPVLPTTPFLLVTFYFYLHSSDRLYQWLIHRKVLGAYIYNYLTYRAVTKNAKVLAFISLWSGLVISIFLINIWYLRVILFFAGIAVSIHLLSLKTREKSELIQRGCKTAAQEINKEVL